MKIIIGLGNYEKKYQHTRHNIGQEIISLFQKTKEFPSFKLNKKLESLVSGEVIDDKKIILALPQTFMNNSGSAVEKILNYYKIKTEDLIIIHDDIDLPLGKIRIKINGSSGGHNGVQSIIDYLKTDNFVRLKIGVANEKRGLVATEKFVLQKFAANEKETVEKIIKRAGEILSEVIAGSVKEETFVI